MQAHEIFSQALAIDSSVLLYIQLRHYMHLVDVRQGLLTIEETLTLKQA
jgi:hypothetical protein